MSIKKPGPRILLVDIETKPLDVHVWSIWQQNVGLNQILSDWCILSWAAKWLDDTPEKIMYADQRSVKDIENDSKILKPLWKLLNEADIVITHNGKKFDVPRINTRFIVHGFKPPSNFKHIDTLVLARKNFAFSSNKLEYLADKLCKKYKKFKHSQFSGHDLWRECIKGNKAAWNCMRDYNKADIMALEELYHKLIPWGTNGVNFAVYGDDSKPACQCGSVLFKKEGHAYTATGKFQRYSCKKCGTWTRSGINELIRDKTSPTHAR